VELTSRHFLAQNLERKINLVHTQPGKPTQNGYVESFNGKLHEECLRINWFQNFFEAREIIANWRCEYNENRPHSSLNYLMSAEFAAKANRGKDADSVRLENDQTVFHFTSVAAAG
jgi:putative transposase